MVSTRRLLVPDIAVDDDATPDAVAVALHYHVGDDSRNRRRERVGPRQPGEVRLFGHRILVQITHAARGVAWPENLVRHALGIEGHDCFCATTRRRKDLVGPENATEPIDGHATSRNCHHHDERYPSPLDKGEHCGSVRWLILLVMQFHAGAGGQT